MIIDTKQLAANARLPGGNQATLFIDPSDQLLVKKTDGTVSPPISSEAIKNELERLNGTERLSVDAINGAPIALTVDASTVGSRTASGTTQFVEVLSLIVPAGTMGRNGKLVGTILASCTNNSNDKQIQIMFGNTVFIGPSTSSGVASILSKFEIWNRGIESQQVCFATASGGIGGIGAAVRTFMIDTTVDQPLSVQMRVSNTSDAFTLEGFSLEIIQPAGVSQ